MKKPEVEPLSDLSWQRVERGVMRELERTDLEIAPAPAKERPRFFAYGLVLAGAASAILGVVGWRLLAPPAGGPPSRIVTAESPTHVAIGESALDVAPQSALLLSGDDERGMLVVLERGNVTCEVAPRHGRPSFRVQAGSVSVRVVGTRFSVGRAGEGGTVSVEHGVVEVTDGGKTVRVGAGERWPLPVEPQILEAPKVLEAPKAIEPPRHAVKKHLTRAAEPPPPAAAAPPPAAPPPPPPAPTVVSVPAPSAQERYEGAARLEAKDPSGAIAIYRSLEDGSDAWAANALYAHGRLEADRGHRDEARRLLTHYGERFPHGVNAQDARHLLDRLR